VFLLTIYRAFQLGIPSTLDITNITGRFQKIGTRFYIFERNIHLNWYAAYIACRKMKAYLVAFDNHDEMNQVISHMKNHNLYIRDKGYWTSGTDLYIQWKHVWFSTGRNVTKDVWSKGQPDGRDDTVRCDMLDLDARYTNGLDDQPCITKLPFICHRASKPRTATFIIF